MKRLLVLALFLVMGVAATSCTDSTNPSDSLAGTYSLRSVNGSSLPVTICPQSSPCYQVLSAEISLDTYGNYQSISRYSDGNESATGTWSLSGNQLTLIDSFDGYASTATVSGSSLAFTNLSGSTYSAVYTK